MCGIIGYIGDNQAAPILIDGLKKLEYRGYDSAGIAVYDKETDKTEVVKTKGKLINLSDKTGGGELVHGFCGIGHTRWATHGEPSELNAHPHISYDREVTLVHNGIIENHVELKAMLEKKGYHTYTQTDTETATNVISYYYNKYNKNPLEAISHAMLRIKGSFAFGILFKEYPDSVFAARKDSPLIVGKGSGGYLIASDVTAILSRSRNVYYIDNMEIAELKVDSVKFYNIDKEEIHKDLVEVKWDTKAAEKDGYEHFMMKEIHEQPQAISKTLHNYIKNGEIDLAEVGIEDSIENIERIYIVACGSAYHVGMSAKYIFEQLSKIPTEVDIASEFRYRDPILLKNSLVIIISQSGETADSLAAMHLAKEHGVKTLGIINVLGSSIARDADHVMYTFAGPEISVATTKAYSAQLGAIYMLAVKFAYVQNKINREKYHELIEELMNLPDKVKELLSQKEEIQQFASKIANVKDVFFIGRGIDYSTAAEGSLKLKEISYVHSEAYAAGELKHGTISLVEDGTLVVGILTDENLMLKTLSNITEVKSRGAFTVTVSCFNDQISSDISDFKITIPKVSHYFAPSLSVIPLQLLAYYVSVAKGLDVDKPRNLAKSVTVE